MSYKRKSLSCKAIHSVDRTVLTGNVLVLDFDSEIYDIGGWHNGTTNPSRLTTPVEADGRLVRLSLSVLTNTGGGSGQLIFHLQRVRNGVDTTIGWFNEANQASINRSIFVHATDLTQAGDYYYAQLSLQSSGATMTVYGEASAPVGVTSFSIETVN